MNLNVIFDAIVPDNIKNIPLVNTAVKIFIEQLNRNAKIAQRIRNIYDIDSNDFYKINEIGVVEYVTDSDFLKASKDNLKQGLMMTYLGLLYSMVSDIQYNSLITEATKMRNYENSKIFKEPYNIITSEFLGAFRHFQQSVGTENAMHYMYQFAKYIETGYLTDDLIVDTDDRTFMIHYKGSLHQHYFTEFLKYLVHPAGWTYTYTTILRIVFEDYFGIQFIYKLPRICIRKNKKYIFFTMLSKDEFLETLRQAVKDDKTRVNTIFQEGPLYYDQDPENSREITFKDIEKFNFYETDEFNFSESELDKLFNDYDILLVHYNYKRYDFFYDEEKIYKNSLITFDNNKFIFFDNSTNVKLGQFTDSNMFFDVAPNTSEYTFEFDGFWSLDCGSEYEITKLSDYVFLYKDETGFNIDFDPTYKRNIYYDSNFEKAFRLDTQNKFIYTQGYDESRYVFLNTNGTYADISDVRKFDDNFILQIPQEFKISTYVEIHSDFGQKYETVLNVDLDQIPRIVSVNTSGYYGENLYLRFANGDYDFNLKCNLLDKRLNATKITKWVRTVNREFVDVYVESSKSKINYTYNTVKKTVSLTNGSCVIRIPNPLTPKANAKFSIDNLNIDTNIFNAKKYVQFPVFNTQQTVTNVVYKKSTYVEPVKQDTKTLFDISKTPEYTINQNVDLNDFYENSYPENTCFIYRGYDLVKCTTTEHCISTSPKFLNDDFKFEYTDSNGYYLTFNDENDACDFEDYEDAKSKNFVSKGRETKTIVLTKPNTKFPETMILGSQRKNLVLTFSKS